MVLGLEVVTGVWVCGSPELRVFVKGQGSRSAVMVGGATKGVWMVEAIIVRF